MELDHFAQDPSMMMDQKPPMYTQQFGPPASHMAQRGYPPAAMQEQGFHPMAGQMGPRPGYPMIRMPARPGLRQPGVPPNQPNTLRMQLQHRLQSQQVRPVACMVTGRTQLLRGLIKCCATCPASAFCLCSQGKRLEMYTPSEKF